MTKTMVQFTLFIRGAFYKGHMRRVTDYSVQPGMDTVASSGNT